MGYSVGAWLRGLLAVAGWLCAFAAAWGLVMRAARAVWAAMGLLVEN